MACRVDTLVHGLLSSQILKKSVTLPLADAAKGQAASHLQTSVGDIISYMFNFHRIWIAPLEVALGLYFFHRFEGITVYLVFIPLSSKLRSIGSYVT